MGDPFLCHVTPSCGLFFCGFDGTCYGQSAINDRVENPPWNSARTLRDVGHSPQWTCWPQSITPLFPGLGFRFQNLWYWRLGFLENLSRLQMGEVFFFICWKSDYGCLGASPGRRLPYLSNGGIIPNVI